MDEQAVWRGKHDITYLSSLRATQNECIEPIGVYQKPVWNLLSDGDFELALAKAAHIKMFPVGRSMSAMRPRSPPFLEHATNAGRISISAAAGGVNLMDPPMFAPRPASLPRRQLSVLP
jgi:hypothetical protein